MTTDIQNTMIVFRTNYINIDKINNIKDFDETVSTFLDNIAQNLTLKDIFLAIREDFLQRSENTTKLEQEALEAVKGQYIEVKKICEKNEIAIPPYRDDFPALETFKDHPKYTEVERLIKMNRFEAYEEGYEQSSNPLVISLSNALKEIINLLHNQNLNLPSILEKDSESFLTWDLECQNLQDCLWNSFLWLAQNNSYGSLLSEEILPYMILMKPLEAMLNLAQPKSSLLPPYEIGKKHIKKIYDHILKQLLSVQVRSQNVLPSVSQTLQTKKVGIPSLSIPLIEVEATLDQNKNIITLSADNKEPLDFERYEKKDCLREEVKRFKLFLLLLKNPEGISKKDTRKQLNMSQTELITAGRGLNERICLKWNLTEDYIKQGKKSKKIKINEVYPTKLHFSL